MTISEIIEKLTALKAEHGDIKTGCDFRIHDDALEYYEELDCILGD